MTSTVTTKETEYGFAIDVQWSQQDAIERVTAALKDEGFGILTTIDVQKTLKDRIDVDREPYVILGACNPDFANQALEIDPEIGLLLPCNVVVYQRDHKTRISMLDPHTLVQVTGNPGIVALANDVRERLSRVLDRLRSE